MRNINVAQSLRKNVFSLSETAIRTPNNSNIKHTATVRSYILITILLLLRKRFTNVSNHCLTRHGVDYCICITSIPIILHCNYSTTRLSYVFIFIAVRA